MSDAPRLGVPAWKRWTMALGALSWHDRALLVETALIISTLPGVLRVVRVQTLIATLGRSLARRQVRGGRTDLRRARQIARVVAMAARHTPNANTCLHRSVVLWRALGLRGLEGQLRMGVRTVDGQLDAHAWVEHGGAVLNDQPDVATRYTPLLASVTTDSVRLTHFK